MTATNQQTDTVIHLWTRHTEIMRRIDASLGGIHGIGFAEYMVLHHLQQSPKHMLRRIDLANVMGRSASGVTKMLNPMEKIGLVAKEKNPRDARVSLVKLTETGLQYLNQASVTLNQVSAQTFKNIDEDQIQHLSHTLKVMGSVSHTHHE